MTLPTKEQVDAVFNVVLHGVFGLAFVAWVVAVFAKMIRDYWKDE